MKFFSFLIIFTMTISSLNALEDQKGNIIPQIASDLKNNKRETKSLFVNATDLGAKCDSHTDDYESIKRALDEAAKEKSEVLLGIGTCLISKPLQVPSNVHISGSGERSILKPYQNNRYNPKLLLIDNKNDVMIRNIVLDGGSYSQDTSDAPLVTVFKSNNILFDSLIVQNSIGIGLNFSTSVTESGVLNSSFVNIGNLWRKTLDRSDQKQGVAFSSGNTKENNSNFVIGSNFADIGLDAVSISKQTNFRVYQNRFTNVGGQAINGGAAIYVAQSDIVNICENIVDRAFGNGIDVYRSHDIRIVDNIVKKSSAGGIIFASGTDCLISRNIVSDSNQDGKSSFTGGIAFNGGIHGQESVARCRVSNNISFDNQKVKTQKYGFQVVKGSIFSSIVIDKTNITYGNAESNFGGEIFDFTSD